MHTAVAPASPRVVRQPSADDDTRNTGRLNSNEQDTTGNRVVFISNTPIISRAVRAMAKSVIPVNSHVLIRRAGAHLFTNCRLLLVDQATDGVPSPFPRRSRDAVGAPVTGTISRVQIGRACMHGAVCCAPTRANPGGAAP
jgi:hypothetical protein